MDVQEHTLDHLLQDAIEAKNAGQFEGSIFTGYTKPANSGSSTRSFIVIRCTKKDCDGFDVKPTNRLDLHPDEFSKVFGKKGWRISGLKKAICPACQSGRKAKPNHAAEPMKLPNELQPDVLLNKTFDSVPEIIDADFACEDTTMNAHSTVQPIADAPQLRTSEKTARAEAYLDEHFVKLGNGTGYYQPGRSDELGAAHAYLPMDTFRKIRDDDYGTVVDYAPVIANVTAALATAERALTQVNGELERLKAYQTKLNDLPSDVQAFLDDLKATHDQLKLDGLAKLEELERDLDATYATVKTRVEDAWAAKQQAMEAAIGPEVDALTAQSASLQRTQRTLNGLMDKLPAELVQAAA
ncbi:MAG: hypothetical protein EON60_10765 [Alphaproteobacteria bacterium]|nr:MAG: hypothetical protein EON60_10765 [Alphaproteobacteria bacterium]